MVAQFNPLSFNRSLLSADPSQVQPTTVMNRSRLSVNGEGGLQYPPDLSTSYFCTLQFAKYSRPTPFDDAKFNAETSIVLPLPKNLKEAFSIDHEERDLGPLIGSAADQATAMFSEEGRKSLEKNTGNIMGGSAVAAGASIIKKVPFIGSDLVDIGAQSLGVILNPHKSFFFRGMQFRRHRFSWELVAQSAADTDIIKSIVNTIKVKALPRFDSGQGSNFLDYPDILMVKLVPDIYTFKKALITDFAFDYTTKGSLAFFKGSKRPVTVSIALEIMEIEIVTAGDYDKDGANQNRVLNAARVVANSMDPTNEETAPANAPAGTGTGGTAGAPGDFT